MRVTWKPHEEHGKLSTADKKELPDSAYAFPEKRKEPMSDGSHVRNAIARFDQVKGVTDDEREQAFANIQAAAHHCQVNMTETHWQELGKKPHIPNSAGKG